MYNSVIVAVFVVVMLNFGSCKATRSSASEARPFKIGTHYYNGLPKWSREGHNLYFLTSVSGLGKEAFTDLAKWRLNSRPDDVEWLTSKQFIFLFRLSEVQNMVSIVRMDRDTGDNVVSILDTSQGRIFDLATHRMQAFPPFVWQSAEEVRALDAGQLYRLNRGQWKAVEGAGKYEECQDVKYEPLRTPEGSFLLFLCARRSGFLKVLSLPDGKEERIGLPEGGTPYDVAVHPRQPVFAVAVSHTWKITDPAHRIYIFERRENGWNVRTTLPTGTYLVRFVGWAGDTLCWHEISLSDPDYSGEGFFRLTDGKMERAETQRLIVGVSDTALFYSPSPIKGFVRKRGTQLWARALSNGGRDIFLLEEGQVRNADVSADGRWIAVEVRRNPSIPFADVWVMQNPLWKDEVLEK
ncbi:MAG: hypothetical protein V2G42_04165 [bacterium JZ-2024 1]